mgnify:CR=1 FL=1
MLPLRNLCFCRSGFVRLYGVNTCRKNLIYKVPSEMMGNVPQTNNGTSNVKKHHLWFGICGFTIHFGRQCGCLWRDWKKAKEF